MMLADLWGDTKELGGALLVAILALSFAALMCAAAYNVVADAGCP